MANDLNWLNSEKYTLDSDENTEEQVEETQEVENTSENKQENTEETAEENKEEVVDEEKPEENKGGEESKTEETKEEDSDPKEEKKQEEDTTEVSETADEEKRSLNESETEEDEEEYEVITVSNILEDVNAKIQEQFGDEVSLSDILEYQAKNFDEMDEFELIQEHFYLQDPDISDRVVQIEMERFEILKKSDQEINEMIEEGDLTREKYNDIRLSFARAANKAKVELKEFQSEMNINDLEFLSSPAEKQPSGPTLEEQQKEAAYFNERIEAFKEVKVQVGDKDNPKELTIEVKNEDTDKIRDFASNGPEGESWITRRWFEDGKLNPDSLVSDINKMINYERDLKIAYAQGAQEKLSEEVKEIDNVDFEKGQSTSSKKDESISTAAQVMREIN